MPRDRPLTFAAIVPATDSAPTLERCLAAIGDARERPEELIAVTDPSGIGPAEARNAGASRTAADVLVFVDADVLVHPDAFVLMRRAFEADPSVSALFGSYDDEPEAKGTVSAFRNLLHHHVHQAGAGAATTFWTGFGAVRRDAFLEVGGFDQELFGAPKASVEDIDLGIRLAASGARTELDPDVQGTHLKRWTLREMIRVDFARRGMPWVALLLRNRARRSQRHGEPAAPPQGGALNLGWTHRLSAAACLVGLVALLMRRPALAVASAAALAGLNWRFYALLARRLGPGGMVAGIGLHAVHHLTAISSVPAGAVLYLRWRGHSAEPHTR